MVALLLILIVSFALHAQDTKVHLDTSKVLQPALRHALLDLNQQMHGPLDAPALARFKALIAQYGWPTAVAAARDGVDAAGDLLQRSSVDYDFQNACLEQVFAQVGIDIDARAALTLNDHIEAAQGHPQQGGMLFLVAHGKVTLSPPADSLATISGFRADYGLPLLADDLRRLQALVDNGVSLSNAASVPRLSKITHTIQLPALRAELGAMTQKDQDARDAYIQSGMKKNSAEEKQVIAIDTANLLRLKAIFAKHGFPNRAMVNRDGVGNAWLLVQHAATDQTFMAKALKLARPLMLKGDLLRSKYALLVDRVRLQQGEKQLYGSQLDGKPGHFVTAPLQDPAHVDQRRALMGLEPLADYIRGTNAAYTPKPAAAISPVPAKASSALR